MATGWRQPEGEPGGDSAQGSTEGWEEQRLGAGRARTQRVPSARTTRPRSRPAPQRPHAHAQGHALNACAAALAALRRPLAGGGRGAGARGGAGGDATAPAERADVSRKCRARPGQPCRHAAEGRDPHRGPAEG